MINDRLVFYFLFTRRDWSCSSFRLRFYHLACLKFSAELFLFVIFFTFSFVFVQLFFIYRLSSRSLRNHYLTLSLFNIIFRLFITTFTLSHWVMSFMLHLHCGQHNHFIAKRKQLLQDSRFENRIHHFFSMHVCEEICCLDRWFLFLALYHQSA